MPRRFRSAALTKARPANAARVSISPISAISTATRSAPITLASLLKYTPKSMRNAVAVVATAFVLVSCAEPVAPGDAVRDAATAKHLAYQSCVDWGHGPVP